MSTPAQITICGALKTETIAALVELAMTAGAALMVQPRAIAAPAAVVEAAPRKALPPARRAKAVRRNAPAPVDEALEPRVRRVLQEEGPMLVGDFLKATRLDKKEARRLVASGAIVATGVTRGRRYALPGHSAKEAP